MYLLFVNKTMEGGENHPFPQRHLLLSVTSSCRNLYILSMQTTGWSVLDQSPGAGKPQAMQVPGMRFL